MEEGCHGEGVGVWGEAVSNKPFLARNPVSDPSLPLSWDAMANVRTIDPPTPFYVRPNPKPEPLVPEWKLEHAQRMGWLWLFVGLGIGYLVHA